MPQPNEDEAMLRGAWRLLRDALGHLAWSAPDQIAWLGSMMHPDELALDYDHAYRVSWMPGEAGWIRNELSRLLAEIDRLTAELTEEGPAPWSAEGLQSHPTWQRLRVLARHALALMPPAPWDSDSDS
ncbi:hypothetical protein [Nonomuraea sp. CA-141351]|uniref:hypothetical protein n=1 Tax=Nonomuraea sp. CA-141351 TaxID=3239996 RepID=UPI003D901941